MPIDPGAVGFVAEPVTRSWDSKDALLYALGVGARSDELAFVTENTDGVPQRVIPTFGVIVGSTGDVLAHAGSFDPAMLVHGSQRLEVHGTIPVSGEVRVTGSIAEIQDKGSAAVVVIAADAVDTATDALLFRTRSTAFIRGAGGFGGSRGSTERVEMPSRSADHVVTYETRPEQALIYRLSGDRNPLHSDPAFAQRGGFAAPILHGLCTYGFTGRALLHAIAGGDADRFGTIDARFSAPVIPGDTLTVEMWESDDDVVLFRTRRESDEVVIDGGRFTTR